MPFLFSLIVLLIGFAVSMIVPLWVRWDRRTLAMVLIWAVTVIIAVLVFCGTIA